jgi:ADP-ribose pyrophosphatase
MADESRPSQPAPPTTVFEGKHIRLVKQGKWEFAQRKGVSGIVAILAVTDDLKLVLVEQFRMPVGKNVIELPAGLAGDVAGSETEELATAAARELMEETGYEARDMTYLAVGVPSAGITDEVITLFRATGLRKTGEGKGDGSEQITLHEVPLAQVEQWLEQKVKEGHLIDLKVYSGLYFARAGR